MLGQNKKWQRFSKECAVVYIAFFLLLRFVFRSSSNFQVGLSNNNKISDFK